MENSKKLVWSYSARNDLQTIYDYYSQFSLIAANKIIDGIMESSCKLEVLGNDKIGQFDEYNSDFRRIISGNYKIFYKSYSENILIVRVFDSRQDPIKFK